MEVASLGWENVYVMVVVSLMEGECSCYRGGQFKRGRMVMLQSSLFNGGGMVVTEVAS